MDVYAHCPRCDRAFRVHFINESVKPCFECPCKALLEVATVGWGELSQINVEHLGTWEVVHHLFRNQDTDWQPSRLMGALRRDLRPGGGG